MIKTSAVLLDDTRARGARGGGSNEGKSKNQSHDAVVVRALLVLGIGVTFLIGESLNQRQKTQPSSGAIGAAVGFLAEYSAGKSRPI